MNNLVKLKSGDGNIVITDEMIIKKTDEFIKDYVLPANYNYNNAVKSFCLAIPDVKGIENATPRSLMLAAQEYVLKGYDIDIVKPITSYLTKRYGKVDSSCLS